MQPHAPMQPMQPMQPMHPCNPMQQPCTCNPHATHMHTRHLVFTSIYLLTLPTFLFNLLQRGYEVFEPKTEEENLEDQQAYMAAREADLHVHGYRRKKQRGINTSFSHDPSVDRVLQQKPLDVGWNLARGRVASPFYLSDNCSNQPDDQLPKVWQLLEHLDEVTCNHHWDKGLCVKDNLRHQVDMLSGMLEPTSCSSSSTSSSLLHPLSYVVAERGKGKNPLTALGSIVQQQPACMFLSAAKVHAAHGIWQAEPRGYARVELGCHKGMPIIEYAHRLVLWSIHGPPPPAAGHCLHICGHKDCLNPTHLVWGTAQDNKDDNGDVYGALLEEQGR